jgi:hypothetical protein
MANRRQLLLALLQTDGKSSRRDAAPRPDSPSAHATTNAPQRAKAANWRLQLLFCSTAI